MLKKLLKSKTFKQTSITTLGVAINGALGALFYIIIARNLGPSSYGLFVISVTTLTLISDIAELGTNTGLVRFVSANLASHQDKAYKFLRLGLEVKILAWFLVMLLGVSFAPTLAEDVFNKPELKIPLMMVMIGAGGALLFTYSLSTLQAFQRFTSWSMLNVTTNLLRLIVLIALIYFQMLSLTNGLFTYLILPFFGFMLAWWLIPFKKILNTKESYLVGREFFSYNLWIALFTLIAAVSSRIDTFLVGRMLSNSEVGIYGAANQLVSIVPQLMGGIGVVVAPKYASLASLKEMWGFFKKLQLMVGGLALVGLLAIPLANFFIPLFYGPDYLAMQEIFTILLIAMLVYLFSVPVHTAIFYYFSKPQVFVVVSAFHLLLVAIGGYFMIQQYQLIGLALVVLAGMVLNFILPLVYFIWRSSKNV